jgi:phosphate-selective porin OprO/OprP
VTEIDLASGEVVLRDVFFALGERPVQGERRFGHYLEPFSLELGTSSNHFAFMERSAVNLLDPARSWGLGWFQVDASETRTLALGVFQNGTDANDFEGGPGSTLGVTGRITVAPLNVDEGRQLLHLGLSLSERWPEDGLIVIKQQAQSPLVEVVGDTATSPFVPQIRIPATFQQLANLQCAAASGPLWGQAEWYGTWVCQRDGSPVFLHGCHADCGWFLTGEHRRYQGVSGVPGAVRVIRPVLRCGESRDRPAGFGAWELVARFAYLDFVDSDVPPGPGGELVGIRLAESTFGVNWYLSDQVRIMFNYSYAVPDEPNTGTSVASVFGTRLAVFW